MSGLGRLSDLAANRMGRAERMEKMAKELGSAAYTLHTGKKYNYSQMLSAYTQIMRGIENLKNGVVEPKQITHLIHDFQRIDVKMQIKIISNLPKEARMSFLNALPTKLREDIITKLQHMAKEKNLLNPKTIKSSTNVA